MFRGREQSRPELGYRLLQRLAADVEELGFVESAPKQDGRNMIMVIGPHKKKAEARAEKAADKADRSGRNDNVESVDQSSAEAPVAETPTTPVPAAAVADAESGVA
jgi:translation initiation factor IF-3